jgi:hypothetical protein
VLAGKKPVLQLVVRCNQDCFIWPRWLLQLAVQGCMSEMVVKAVAVIGVSASMSVHCW